jgi:hypothetical protein
MPLLFSSSGTKLSACRLVTYCSTYAACVRSKIKGMSVFVHSCDDMIVIENILQTPYLPISSTFLARASLRN